MDDQEKSTHSSETLEKRMERFKLTLIEHGRTDEEIADFERRTAECQRAGRKLRERNSGDPFLAGLERVCRRHETDTAAGRRAACVQYIAQHIAVLYGLKAQETFAAVMEAVNIYGSNVVRQTAAEMVQEGRKASIKQPMRVFDWRCSKRKNSKRSA